MDIRHTIDHVDRVERTETVDAVTILRIMIFLITLLALPAGIIALSVTFVRRSQRAAHGEGAAAAEPGSALPGGQLPVEWDRLLLYILAFAGLMTVLVAVSGLLALGVGLILQNVTDLGTLISTADAKTKVASNFAALIVGASVWLACWQATDRRVMRAPAERDALERRLFLAATFAGTSIVALFALQATLHALLTLPGSVDRTASARDAVTSGAQFLVYGVAWLLYARLGWRERGPRATDLLHDLAVYALAGFALIFLSIGLGDAVHHLVMAVQGTPENVSPADSTSVTWSTWGGIASWSLAGGLVWTAIWGYDVRRNGVRALRVVYLYLVLAVAAPTAAITAGDTLFEVLRRAFGYEGGPNNWGFLADSLPPLLVAGAIWAYHWIIVRRQAALLDGSAAMSKGISWPRRLAIAVLSFGGLAATVTGSVAIVWVGIDAILTTHAHGADWWRDSLSAGLAVALVGSATWLPAWILLQRAAAASPERERAAWERRGLLAAVVLVGSLAVIGFGAATLYQILRGILQTTDATTLSDGLKYGSTATIAAAVAAYHFSVLRRERHQRTPVPSSTEHAVRVQVLIAPGGEESLAELRQGSGRCMQVVGYLAADVAEPAADLATLQGRLATLGSGGLDGALLLLGAHGGVLYPYTRASATTLSRPNVTRPPGPRVTAERQS
jgi:hypothetical protein